MDKKVTIIGAGVGGLSTAVRLAGKGYEVEVYEKQPRCGGRANCIKDKGFMFDTGPSFILMPDFFEELFGYCGLSIEDYLKLRVLETNYKIFYPNRKVLNVYKDPERTKEELEQFETGSAAAYDRYIDAMREMYNVVRPLLYKCVTPASLADVRYWPLVKKLRVFETYWNFARRFFKSDALCYAFTFEAMFIGVSPFTTPAFYSVISYADQVQHIYHPMGGMYELPRALEKIALARGVQFHYGKEVTRITKKNDALTYMVDNQEARADTMVVNADYAYAQESLLYRKIPKYTYSCSVYLLYLGLKKKVEGLAHHNLFFARDLQRNLKEIFDAKIIPEDPSFYVHVPTVTDPSLAPPGKDIAYILVPVPNLETVAQDFRVHEAMVRTTVFRRIQEATGINLADLIEVEHRFYPREFLDRYNIKFAATFGLAHTFMQSAFFRPPNFDRSIPNLYYAGASTQPGGGLPVVIASSRIVAEKIDRA